MSNINDGNPYLRYTLYNKAKSEQAISERLGLPYSEIEKQYNKMYASHENISEVNKILHARIEYLLEKFNLWDEYGLFIFPDKAIYRKNYA